MSCFRFRGQRVKLAWRKPAKAALTTFMRKLIEQVLRALLIRALPVSALTQDISDIINARIASLMPNWK